MHDSLSSHYFFLEPLSSLIDMVRRAGSCFPHLVLLSKAFSVHCTELLGNVLGYSLPSCAFVLVSGDKSRTYYSSSSSCTMSKKLETNTDTFPYTFVALKDSAWARDPEMSPEALLRCVPPMASDEHKGSLGRVGVMGGSRTFTGAPYYASMAALKVGADLAYCFCAEEASIPLKCYSPELMVAPIYRAADFDSLVNEGQTNSEQADLLVQDMVEKVAEMMGKLHVLVIGPGLGRCPLVMAATSRIIRKALDMQIPLVLDADALYILTLPEYQDLLNASTKNSSENHSLNQSIVVLTPNLMERKRLSGMEDRWDPDRVIVLEKGDEDVIRSKIQGVESTLICTERGGLKRCGGIGDILAGTLGTFLAWNSILVERGVACRNDAVLSAWMASSLVKRSTHVAFHQHFRSTTAPDILSKIGPTFHGMISIWQFPQATSS